MGKCSFLGGSLMGSTRIRNTGNPVFDHHGPFWRSTGLVPGPARRRLPNIRCPPRFLHPEGCVAQTLGHHPSFLLKIRNDTAIPGPVPTLRHGNCQRAPYRSVVLKEGHADAANPRFPFVQVQAVAAVAGQRELYLDLFPGDFGMRGAPLGAVGQIVIPQPARIELGQHGFA